MRTLRKLRIRLMITATRITATQLTRVILTTIPTTILIIIITGGHRFPLVFIGPGTRITVTHMVTTIRITGFTRTIGDMAELMAIHTPLVIMVGPVTMVRPVTTLRPGS